MSIETNQICPWVPAEPKPQHQHTKTTAFQCSRTGIWPLRMKWKSSIEESTLSQSRVRKQLIQALPPSSSLWNSDTKRFETLFKSKSFGCGGRWWIAYLHSCHSMRVSNLLNTEDLTVGEIKGENLEARGQGFIREEGEYLEVVLATAPLLQWSFRFLNPVETALEFVREKIAVVADIFCWFVVVFSVWFMF